MPHASIARLLCLTIALGALVAFTGCETAGPTRSAATPKAQRDLLIASDDAVAMGYGIGWTTNLGVPNRNHIQAVKRLGERLIVIEEPNSLVRSISVADGSIEWTRQIGELSEDLLGAYQIDNVLYIATDAKVWQLRPTTGEVISAGTLDHKSVAEAAELDPLLVMGGIDGRVFGYDPARGFATWEYKLASSITAPVIPNPPYVFAADTTGVYAMIDSRGGQLRWRGRTFEAVQAAAALDRLAVYIPSTDRSLYAVDINDGRDRWIYRSRYPLTRSPVVLGLSVYQPIDQAGLVSLSTRDGSEQWVHPEALTPLASDDRTLLAFGDDSIAQLSVADGSVLEQAPTDRLQTAMVLDDGTLLLVSPRGEMLTLNPLNPVGDDASVARAD